MYGLGRIVLILLTIGLIGVAAWQGAVHWRPSVENYPVQGVDVSEADGAIEWNAVAGAGADFAYTVATRGAGQRDRTFEENWRGIDAAGLRRGAVHIWSLCQLAVDQANAFNTVVPRDDAALPAAIDVDYTPDCTARPDRDVLIGEIARGATIIEAHVGKPVLLRLGRKLEADYRLSERLPRSIWAIGNFFPPDYAARPWRMWRASDVREVAGIADGAKWDVAAK